MTTIDLALMTLAGPWGPFRVVATARGVVSAAWAIDDRPADMPDRSDPAGEAWSGPAAELLRAIRPTIIRIIEGEPIDVRAVPVDLTESAPFDQRVLTAVREIAWGETASYGEIARRAGSPRAARATGGAVKRNPVSMLIPCHRVIASDGTLGGYGGDGPRERAEALERKRALLLREGLNIHERRR